MLVPSLARVSVAFAVVVSATFGGTASFIPPTGFPLVDFVAVVVASSLGFFHLLYFSVIASLVLVNLSVKLRPLEVNVVNTLNPVDNPVIRLPI